MTTVPSTRDGQQVYNRESDLSPGDWLSPVWAPPMSQRNLLSVMMLGFGLVILLLAAAAYVGYQGSRSIQDNAQQMVRDHLVAGDRASALEAQIERESESLLSKLVWVLGACFVLAAVCSTLTLWFTSRTLGRLDWQTQELNRVSWYMIENQEKVARRYSHEMHDELGQGLAGLRGLAKRLSAAEFEQRRGELIEVIDEVLAGVRELSQLLRPVILDDLGLDAGLRWLSDRFSQRTQIPTQYESNLKERLPEGLETHLFRICQEALSNVARHSGATKATVRLTAGEHWIHLTIEDDGKGIADFGARSGSSLGMVGMRARARHLDGELLIVKNEPRGLRIEVKAPRREKDGDERQADSNFAG